MDSIKPDFRWYASQSQRHALQSLRCPFASVHFCPRYYQSLSLLGGAGCTSIPEREDAALLERWKTHPLWPVTAEQETSITRAGGKLIGYHKFCPEVAYDAFGLFATFLSHYADDIDRDVALAHLAAEGASADDPRRTWAFITPQHYSECPLYSPLSHHGVTKATKPAINQSLGDGSYRFDVFISHASEDKDAFVRPLADALTALGLNVWYDEWTLKLGDSLRAEIDRGLANSQFGVVVVSRSFFAKEWPQAELDGLFAREMEGRKVILPVWHDITKQEVSRHSPILAAKLATVTEKGVNAVAAEIHGVVRSNGSSRSQDTSRSAWPLTDKPESPKGGVYSSELGKRHRHLREKILGINPRRMADFYGFEKVAQLEAFERGDEEFPTASIKRLRDFFFVSREYLEAEQNEVFDSFDVISSADDCKRLIGEGFRPFLFCLNEDRRNFWCWPVLHKEQDGLDRIVSANSFGYFASKGGGKSNVMHLIEGAHHCGLDAYDVIVMGADRKLWNKLEGRIYYQIGLGYGAGLRGPDNAGQDRFLAWWKEFEEKKRA